jgi:hypothetical protein
VATGLFDEGRQLLEAGRYDEACPKFLASARLVRSSGTLLNLTDCYDRLGRAASAWAQFREAAAEAARAGRTIEEVEARRRASEIEPRVAHVSVSAATEASVEVRCDGVPLERAAWDKIPLDAGKHELSASAPGKLSWRESFELADGQELAVAIPALLDVPSEPIVRRRAAPAPAPARQDARGKPASARSSAQHDYGLVLSGLGLLGVGAGGAFGWSAHSLWQDEQARCRSSNLCDSGPARSAGNLSTIAFSAGVAALAGGLLLVVTAPAGR